MTTDQDIKFEVFNRLSEALSRVYEGKLKLQQFKLFPSSILDYDERMKAKEISSRIKSELKLITGMVNEYEKL